MIHALRYTEELEKVGFTTEQAKKSVQVWMDFMDSTIATKADLKEYYFMSKHDDMEAKSELKAAYDTLKERLMTLEKKIDTIEYRLTIKMGLMTATAVGILATLITFK